jgi:hypothetical protein
LTRFNALNASSRNSPYHRSFTRNFFDSDRLTST